MTHGVGDCRESKSYITVRIVWEDGTQQIFNDKILNCSVVYNPDPPGSSYVCMKVDREGPFRYEHIYRRPRSVWIMPLMWSGDNVW